MKRRFISLLLTAVFLTGCAELFTRTDQPSEPPQMTVLTERGEYPAVRFGYEWQIRDGEAVIADGVDPLGYAFTPIEAAAGEYVQIAFSDEKYGPTTFTVYFYAEGGDGEGKTVEYDLNRGDDPRFAERACALFPAVSDGIYVVEAVWPSWYRDGINGEATYAFALSVHAD